MTFLSITPDALNASSTATRASALRHPRASFLAQMAAITLFTASMTVPGAVAQAKWSKLNLVIGFVQHRCVAAFSA